MERGADVPVFTPALLAPPPGAGSAFPRSQLALFAAGRVVFFILGAVMPVHLHPHLRGREKRRGVH